MIPGNDPINPTAIKTHLDQRCEEIDADTLQQIRASRVAALAKVETQNNLWKRPAAYSLAGFAMFAIMSVAIYLAPIREQPPQLANTAFEDLPIILRTQSLEFFENMDFYIWMTTEIHDDLG